MPLKSAQPLLDRYWDHRLPVDPVAIARAAGVQVQAAHLGSDAGKLEILSGTPPLPVIWISDTDAHLRQRFTVAHELGHFALGHGASFVDGKDSFSLANSDPLEVAANRFAAELLMPEFAITVLIMRRNETDLRKLAKAFGVAPLAMRVRLDQLGWI
ncbi:ImmA/IrrE family metallo-endopeptidase [Cupriavidus sp. AU9028]|uniref:ImmA/IrrE family metallo-endopeptidase n=1 Tax=Cupriavidus sp. AU9028 TaxID=2871157 RepID=UPI001C946F44|nr:ImmA/IrrE family metallo-endopeptidase [Cupriavidus sp. AU9028]MBY4897284.1 ImmA/IrrE family metallo-endopeptidase [Cupriavidus sp. AU9028]